MSGCGGYDLPPYVHEVRAYDNFPTVLYYTSDSFLGLYKIPQPRFFYSGPSITHLITVFPSFPLPLLVTSNASRASLNLKVCVRRGLRSTSPLATRSIAKGLHISSRSEILIGVFGLTSHLDHIANSPSTGFLPSSDGIRGW
jgi:hypothetical protein